MDHATTVWTIKWMPDGVVTEQFVDGQRYSHSVHGTIEAALDGLRIVLEAQEEAYRFPRERFPTADHVLAEKLALGIEKRLGELES